MNCTVKKEAKRATGNNGRRSLKDTRGRSIRMTEGMQRRRKNLRSGKQEAEDTEGTVKEVNIVHVTREPKAV